MIITCPSCTKRYLVEDSSIEEAGRQVKCVACEHAWFFTPPKEAPVQNDINQLQLDLMGVKSSVSSEKSVGGLSIFYFLGTLLILVSTLYVFRAPLVENIPALESIMTSLGLTAQDPKDVLTFQDIVVSKESRPKGEEMLVRGSLTNTSNKVQQVPKFQLKVKGDCSQATFVEQGITQYIKQQSSNTCTLKTWVYEPSESRIFPGEKLHFETSLGKPLKGSESVSVNFE